MKAAVAGNAGPATGQTILRQNNLTWRTRLHVSSQTGFDGGFGLKADELVHQLSAFEDQHGRQAGDVEVRGNLWVLVGIELADNVALVRFARERLDARRPR